PAFAGEGDAIPLVESAKGGDAIISGIGIDTGNVAPRAAGIVWMAGPHSMLDDVNFAAGHGRIGRRGTAWWWTGWRRRWSSSRCAEWWCEWCTRPAASGRIRARPQHSGD